MICSKCGYEISDQATFCPYCGQGVNRSADTGSTSDTRYSQGNGQGSGSDWNNPGYRNTGYSYQGQQSSGYSTRPRAPRITLEDLPPELKPMHAWSYVGWGFLFAIPIVGLVLVIVFSCVSGNINRKRFARSYLCWFLILIVITAILMIAGAVTWNQLTHGQLFGLKLW